VKILSFATLGGVVDGWVTVMELIAAVEELLVINTKRTTIIN